MTVDIEPSEALRIVVGMFERFLASPQSLFDIEEKIRFDRGKAVAHTYLVDGLMAMWLMEIGIIQFYDEEGNMLATVHLHENNAPQLIAA